MKIVIALPSKNESDSIVRMVKSIDEAVIQASDGEKIEVTLLNVDCSEDNTKNLFLSTETSCKKEAISVDSGKGMAMREAIRFADKYDFDIIIFTDTDLEKFHLSWLKSFISYTASGYDAIYLWRCPKWNAQDMTNQICYPILRCIFNIAIHEPIGGEFSLSRKAIKYFSVKEWPEYTLNYGVDFFIITEIAQSLNIIEIPIMEGKGNKLRSYINKVDSIIFGNKFYEVFISTMKCCAPHYPKHRNQHAYMLNFPWSFAIIPDNSEMNSLCESTYNGIANKRKELNTVLSLETQSKLNKLIDIELFSYQGVTWDLWTDIMIECLYFYKSSEMNLQQLEAVEQVFLARTYNHYCMNKDKANWFYAIEHNVDALDKKFLKLSI